MHSSRKFLLVLAALATCLPASFAAAQAQSSASPLAGNGTYIQIDPLANVRYDNRFDISAGMAYAHFKAGPDLTDGANLGGIDLSGTYWFSRHWGAEGSGRAYMGTSAAAPNTQHINGPFVGQYMFLGGAEWLGPHNKHAALIAHVLGGGAYGQFEKDLRHNPPSTVDFYHDQTAPAAVFGGHIDLNRSARWVFRITPDALMTRYKSDFATTLHAPGTFTNWNFGISVGAMYRFKTKR